MANDIPVGLRVPAQVPLDDKTYKINEAALQDLGVDNTLAYTYHKGLRVLCIEERTIYEWKEMEVGDIGLLPSDFVYPDGVVEYGVDYSNKAYNFVNTAIVIPTPIPPPLEKIDEGNGVGIIIRGRVADNYGNVGLNAVDLSFSDSASSTNGATGEFSFTVGNNLIASAKTSVAIGEYNTVTAYGAVALGSNHTVEAEYAFAEGFWNEIEPGADWSHAEGTGTGVRAGAAGGHAEGENTDVEGIAGHAEGSGTTSVGFAAHSEGYRTYAQGNYSHTEGEQSIAYGRGSHAGGIFTEAYSIGETSIGTYPTYSTGNISTYIPTDRLFNIGNGTSEGTRSNAFTLLKNGLATLPSVTNALITAASGKAIVTKEYLSSVLPVIDGSETKINSGITTTKTGSGTVANPYIIEINNLQKVITYPTDFIGTNYTLTSADNNYEIIIDNGVTAVSITVPSGLISKIGIGFTQKGTGDVSYVASGTTINNPIGLKIKGQYYQTYLSQEAATNIYYLGGNTKV